MVINPHNKMALNGPVGGVRAISHSKLRLTLGRRRWLFTATLSPAQPRMIVNGSRRTPPTPRHPEVVRAVRQAADDRRAPEQIPLHKPQ
jgi:hypothetical protein